MMNTDNRLLTRESSEHIREFFSTVERLSVSMERLFAGRSPAMAGENFYTDREPVSYTHLDVYKRQVLQWITFPFPIISIVSSILLTKVTDLISGASVTTSLGNRNIRGPYFM